MGSMASQVRARAKTVLEASGERFLGPGVVELLRAVDEIGSVKHACASMGLSYTKGWRLVRTLEAALGLACVVRQQGGVGGGRASLTDDCRTLLARFAAFTTEVDADVDDRFARHFPELAEPRDAALA
jgi:molybdate transport repressor ModE-like protein